MPRRYDILIDSEFTEFGHIALLEAGRTARRLHAVVLINLEEVDTLGGPQGDIVSSRAYQLGDVYVEKLDLVDLLKSLRLVLRRCLGWPFSIELLAISVDLDESYIAVCLAKD